MSQSVRSEMPRPEWRGSLTVFNGMTSTRPSQEVEDQTYEVIKNTLCPDKPSVGTDKSRLDYALPCRLKEAPLVGNTLRQAEIAGSPTTGKMRSKDHVTEAHLIMMDLDGLEESVFQVGIDELKADGISFLVYSSFSHGNPSKPGTRARLVIPLDNPLDNSNYSKAWHGVDQRYFGGQVAQKDTSSARLCQQQGIWATNPEWADQAFKIDHPAGVASSEFFIEKGSNVVERPATPAPTAERNIQDYPPSDANQVADRCQQIGAFRDKKGVGQPEPLWNDCLGVVGHCENGHEKAQEFSSGYSDYSREATANKLAHRLKIGPTTCEQFKRTNPDGCMGCQQSCNSPITLGWPEKPVCPQDRAIVKPVAPRHEDIDLIGLLNATQSILQRYVVMDNYQAIAVTLWIAMTWGVAAIGTLPLLLINAPERACGKTQALDLIGRIVCNALTAVNVTAPVLFRMIEKHGPTLLLDEVDTFFRDKSSEIAGIINAGHTRSSAVVYRLVGENHEPKAFSVYCPKALAGITLEKHIPDATMSRGIVINMKRKLPGEGIERLRHADSADFERLQSQFAKFGADYLEQIAKAKPELPDQLDDRQQDNWEPLLAIADLAGGDWSDQARAAALALSVDSAPYVCLSTQLLMDIRQVFEHKKVFKISTSDLIEALCKDEEAPWATFNRGKEMSARQLGSQLSRYSIHSKTVRLSKYETPKGYSVDQFEDAFARYLAPAVASTDPENLPQLRNDLPQPMPAMDSAVAEDPQHCGNDAATPPQLAVAETPTKITDTSYERSATRGSEPLDMPSVAIGNEEAF